MSTGKNLLIIYAGYYGIEPDPKIQNKPGSTATIAKWLGEGASSILGTNVKIVRARDLKDTTLVNSADGFLIGSGVYNGNPEEEFIEFIDNILLAGKATTTPHIKNKPFGVFCTSAGYATGAQPVLNALARSFMTFNGVYVGGDSWKTGQGLCGMVKDNATVPPSWDWTEHSANTIEMDAKNYGKRLAIVTSFYNEQFNNISNMPSKPGQSFLCPNNTGECELLTKCDNNNNLLIVILSIIILFLFIVILILLTNR